MIERLIKLIFAFLLLIGLQMGILSKISLWGISGSMLYIYYLLFLPSQINRNWLITIGFLLGLTVDWLCQTGGIHAFVSTITAYMIQPLSIFVSDKQKREEYYSRGRDWGVMIVIFLLHHLLFFGIEFYSIDGIGRILLKTSLSTILDVFLAYLIANIFCEDHDRSAGRI